MLLQSKCKKNITAPKLIAVVVQKTGLGHLLSLTGCFAAGMRRKVGIKNQQPFLVARLLCHCSNSWVHASLDHEPQTGGRNKYYGKKNLKSAYSHAQQSQERQIS